MSAWPKVVDRATALIKHCDTINSVGIRQFVAVVEVVVKALIGTHEFRASVVRFGHHGAEIGLDGNLFAHGATGTNGGLVLESHHDRVAVCVGQPLAVLGGLADSCGVSVFLLCIVRKHVHRHGESGEGWR